MFEELAQGPSTSSVPSLVSQAVSEIHLGRLEEADAALTQAREKMDAAGQKDEVTLANSAVLDLLLARGGSISDVIKKLPPACELAEDLKTKQIEFESAAAKYAPSFAA